VLQVPPDQLARRLDALLQGIASIASKDVALSYTEYHNRLAPL
jgi:hypothetical protein